MKRVILAVLGVALATSAAAVPQYSQLRQDYPQIDDAIAAATESDLNGTFGRLSALYQRSPINGLGTDAGTNGQLPSNFLRNLEATLIDLQEDLGKDQVGALSIEQKLVLLQVVNIYAVARPLELWASEVITTCGPFTACPPGEEYCPPCIDDDPAVINEVQDVVSAARPLYKAAYDSLTADQQVGLVVPNSLTPGNLAGAMGTMLTIKGVESIDD